MANACAQEGEQLSLLEQSRRAANAYIPSYMEVQCAELFQQHKVARLGTYRAALYGGLLAAVSASPMRSLMVHKCRCYQACQSNDLCLALVPCPEGNSQKSFSTYRKQQSHAPRSLFAAGTWGSSSVASYQSKFGIRVCATLRESFSLIVALFSSSRKTLIARA